MENFTKIVPVYNRPEDRNIDFLSKIYSDHELMGDLIQTLTNDVLLKSDVISGKKILLKPNWVKHSSKQDDELCLRTNNNFIITILKLLLKYGPAKVVIGDAPIQGCHWNQMLDESFYNNIELLSNESCVPITIMDFRRVTFDPLLNNPQKELHPISEYIIIDTGLESWLEPISYENKANFRVTCYDPRKLAESHKKGVHKYCITRELFEADIIISLPKIKTHQKTGITGALKNLVGLNGDKDYLPHHRVGGSSYGGDCYPGKNLLRRGAELALDYANQNQGKMRYWAGIQISDLLWKLSRPKPVHQISAGWYGNDTSWRMVMDINHISRFALKNGPLSNKPQRQVFSICDGIIGGQGNGPLNPEPLPLGIISFSNSNSLNDLCMITLMGFDYNKFPLLTGASQTIDIDSAVISYNNTTVKLSELYKYSTKTIPPPGWIEYLK